jgi:beta-hydroxylase
MFSMHEPGTHLPRHRGVTKGMVTCHLGLKIPADGATRDFYRRQIV